MAWPGWILTVGAKLSGINIKGLLDVVKPLLPYAACFAVGWVWQGHRLGAKQVAAQLLAKDQVIQSTEIKLETERSLVLIRDEKISNFKDAAEKSDKRIDDLEGRVVEMAARIPVDKTTVIDKTKDQVDALIAQDDTFKWLRFVYPRSMLDDTNRAIRESREYGNPIPALAGDKPDRPDT